jgi:hypothetical protein
MHKISSLAERERKRENEGKKEGRKERERRKKVSAGCQWLISVILATQEAEIRKITI